MYRGDGWTDMMKLGLTWAGGEYLWRSTQVIATLVLGLLTLVGFVLWQWKGAKFPLVPRKPYTSPRNSMQLLMFLLVAPQCIYSRMDWSMVPA